MWTSGCTYIGGTTSKKHLCTDMGELLKNYLQIKTMKTSGFLPVTTKQTKQNKWNGGVIYQPPPTTLQE